VVEIVRWVFVANLIHFPALKEYGRFVNICHSYSQNKSGTVFAAHGVYALAQRCRVTNRNIDVAATEQSFVSSASCDF